MTNLATRNLLLSQISSSDIALLGGLVKIDLPLTRSLELADTKIEYVYFVEDGLASVVESMPEKGAVEVGVIGFEGMTGLAIILGDTQSPFDTYMQCEGSAQRIDAAALRSGMLESRTLQAHLLLYARAFTIQVATTAFANGRSSLVERLARWLLMIGDRMGPTFRITHEFLSTMLAVRRSGVTEALQGLESKGMIVNTRGTIHIVSRELLIEASCGNYGRAELEYQRLLPIAKTSKKPAG